MGEIVHAHVAYVLAGAGVRALHIKGPTVAGWLFEPGDREWGDVDVLVAPDEVDEALRALREAGALERYPGMGADSSDDHAITLVHHPDPDGPSTEIDVHRYFEGIGAPPARAFDELWRRREPVRLAHTQAWFPDLTSRALFIALNVARSPHAKALRDLDRLLARLDAEDWEALAELGLRLDAGPALRAGLEHHRDGADVVARTSLRDVVVSPEWRLRIEGGPRTAVRLAQLPSMDWGHRVRAVARWVVPRPEVIRMRDQRVGGGTRSLVIGYVRRWGDGARTLVPSIVALRHARRVRGAPRL